MPNSKTPTTTPFPSFAVEQESNPSFSRYSSLPTPTSMRATVLFGLPLRSFMTNEPLPDSAIQHYIDEAVSEVEHILDMYIAPVKFQERHDYSRHLFFWSFGYMKVNHGPILDVSKFQLSFNNGQGAPGSVPLVDIPLEFIHVQPQDQTLQLVPAQGVSISGLVVSIYSGLGFHAFNSQALSYWPGAVLVEYRAGFEDGKVPAMLTGLIENLAAYKLLSIMGPLLFPHNSVSIGIDGTSQSTSNPGPAFLKQRMDELDKTVQSQTEIAKSYYYKRFMVDFI